jgi:two-component system, NtrC family, sensor kinase
MTESTHPLTVDHPPKDIVLIVDDNPTNLGVLSDVLDRAGWSVSAVKSGVKALERIQFIRPDLILLDVMMPEMDGFETCQRLKAMPDMQHIPIIFMTALSDVSDKVKGFELGAVDYITKPFQQAEVIARAQTHLKLYRLQQEVQQYNADLEAQVQHRTQELETVIETLKSTQLQLVQTEKMSSLGQLVAGIAHEINNPVNFIHGNLAHAESYMQQMLEAIAIYRPLAHDIAAKVGVNDALMAIDEDELDFTQEDFPKLLQSMRTGTTRIRDIVSGLRTFSRIDESPCKEIDLHESIDSTLIILRSRLKSKGEYPEVEVVRNYGDLAPIECYSGELNQVFMNIFGNAIDAIQERYHAQLVGAIQPSVGRIEITTQLGEAQTVRITITDNGIGMSDATRNKIFEPFFTTKNVGKGTGLGLALAYAIVTEKHQGELICTSEVGQGTRFEICLPKQVAIAAHAAPNALL